MLFYLASPTIVAVSPSLHRSLQRALQYPLPPRLCRPSPRLVRALLFALVKLPVRALTAHLAGGCLQVATAVRQVLELEMRLVAGLEVRPALRRANRRYMRQELVKKLKLI